MYIDSTVTFGNTMNMYIQIMAEINSNDGCKGNEAANVDDMDYRSKAAKMKAQDDSKFYYLLIM